MKSNRKALICLLLALALLVCGCAAKAEKSVKYVDVYRIAKSDGGGRLLSPERYPVNGEQDMIAAVCLGLNSLPAADGMTRAFPDDVKICSYTRDGAAVTVDMTPAYQKLDGISRHIADYALACSLLMLDSVCEVGISCGGETLVSGLNGENALLADAGYEECEKIHKIFLPAADGGGLEMKSARLGVRSDDSETALLAKKVLSGIPSVPSGTRVLSAEVMGSICILDISEEFLEAAPESEDEARLVIYSLVNSLTYLREVQAVIIQVESRTISDYGGYRASWPKGFDYELTRYGD